MTRIQKVTCGCIWKYGRVSDLEKLGACVRHWETPTTTAQSGTIPSGYTSGLKRKEPSSIVRGEKVVPEDEE